MKRKKPYLLAGLVLLLFLLCTACGNAEGQIAPQDDPNEGLGGGFNEDTVNDFSSYEGIWLGEANNEYDYIEFDADGNWQLYLMGTSYATKEAVMTRIWNCVPYTLELAAISIFIAAVIGTPIGIISATKQYTAFDNVTMIFALIGISMPVFWIGILLILLFSVHLKWLPPSGWGTMKQMILPAITVAAQSVAVICRMTRSSMLEVIRQDYIRTVRAKGQKEYKIIISHALRNALIPIVTVIGLQFGALLGGAIMAETVFAIPGLGRLMIDAIKQRDYPIVQGVVLFVAVTFSLVNLLIDIIYAFIDPKIRAQYK